MNPISLLRIRARAAVEVRHRLAVERVSAFRRRIEQAGMKGRDLPAGRSGDGHVFALGDGQMNLRQRVFHFVVKNFLDAIKMNRGSGYFGFWILDFGFLTAAAKGFDGRQSWPEFRRSPSKPR